MDQLEPGSLAIRIGRTRGEGYRLISEHTIEEENILKKSKQKLQLQKTVMSRRLHHGLLCVSFDIRGLSFQDSNKVREVEARPSSRTWYLFSRIILSFHFFSINFSSCINIDICILVWAFKFC
jgi:hypothetical protein